MSRKRSRKNRKPKASLKNPQENQSPKPQIRDPIESPGQQLIELLKQAPVKFWCWAIGIFITIISSTFIIGAGLGQTDTFMDFFNNKTRSKFENERDAHIVTKAQLNDTKKSLNKTERQLSQLQKELVKTREKHKILEQIGDDFWFYRSYDIRKEMRTSIHIGTCGRVPCYNIVLANFRREAEEVVFEVFGPGFGIYGNGGPGIPIIFKEGCGAEFFAQKQKFLLFIEDDSLTSLRAGLSIKVLDKKRFSGEGVTIGRKGCDFLKVRQDG